MAAIITTSIQVSKKPHFLSTTTSPVLPISTFNHQLPHLSFHQYPNYNILVRTMAYSTSTHDLKYPVEKPRTGADVLAEALQREGVTHIFGFPGDASLEILEAIRRCKTIKNVFARHEQGSVFAAEGYARTLGVPGVCITTSGPSATNIMTGLADAYLDSIPLVVITGQVPSHLMGTHCLQDTPIVEVTRPITKRNYLILDVEDIPRIIKEAFFVAKSGRPGPVLIDIPNDIHVNMMVPQWDQPMRLDEYLSSLPQPPSQISLEKIVRMIYEAESPVLCVGGGCLDSAKELRRFVELTGIPVASTMNSLGSYPCDDEEHSLQMLGLYGTVHANYAVEKCDLLLAFGFTFHHQATGKLDMFASKAKIVNIDIDPIEISKNTKLITSDLLSVCADVKLALDGLNSIILQGNTKCLDFSSWRKEINEQRCSTTTFSYPSVVTTNHDKMSDDDVIHPWYVVQVLDELTNGNAIICTGAGEHQMWATQFYTHKHPRHLLTPGGVCANGIRTTSGYRCSYSKAGCCGCRP